ncbi:hypothetical protein DFP74_4001 [Nocardiopsis sp. Huas11]|uniref:hypothetical protein n=1 Tax=Nocardiopsis sp. Huas11 TaxID=2183912 RepID=UPI000EAF247B|nr:hypothetical protein [Nocardiopsis sp. Huas11]RKS08305.1 hypothetical protein DFP74_4001 [Nocardiopsis sp. Huas11]
MSGVEFALGSGEVGGRGTRLLADPCGAGLGLARRGTQILVPHGEGGRLLGRMAGGRGGVVGRLAGRFGLTLGPGSFAVGSGGRQPRGRNLVVRQPGDIALPVRDLLAQAPDPLLHGGDLRAGSVRPVL